MVRSIGMAILLLALSCPLVEAAEACRVNQVQGKVQALRNGQIIDLKDKDFLEKGDHILTGTDGSTIDMTMNDMAGCRILPGSEVEITGWKPENMLLNVIKGNLIVNLKKLPADSNFHVETPTAVATVRGTQFWGRVQSESTSPLATFAVREGIVDVMSKYPSLIFSLEPGKAIDIPKTAVAGQTAMREALPEELKAMEQADAIPTETL